MLSGTVFAAYGHVIYQWNEYAGAEDHLASAASKARRKGAEYSGRGICPLGDSPRSQGQARSELNPAGDCHRFVLGATCRRTTQGPEEDQQGPEEDQEEQRLEDEQTRPRLDGWSEAHIASIP